MSIFPSVKLFWLSCIMLEKLGWLIYSGSFTVRGCFTLIWNDSINHMHFRAAYVKDILPFARTYTEKSVDSYLCFRLVLLHSVSYFVFPYQSPSSPLCKIFDAFSSNINEVLSIKPSANLPWWTLLQLLDLTQMANFSNRITDCDYHSSPVLHLFIYLFIVKLVFILQWIPLHWKILIMLLSQIPLTFCQTQNNMSYFIT